MLIHQWHPNQTGTPIQTGRPRETILEPRESDHRQAYLPGSGIDAVIATALREIYRPNHHTSVTSVSRKIGLVHGAFLGWIGRSTGEIRKLVTMAEAGLLSPNGPAKLAQAQPEMTLIALHYTLTRPTAFRISSQTLTHALSRSAFISANGLSGGITA